MRALSMWTLNANVESQLKPILLELIILPKMVKNMFLTNNTPGHVDFAYSKQVNASC